MLRACLSSKILVSLSIALIAIPCFSQELSFQLDSVETRVFESKVLGQTFVISVQLPTRLKDGSERFPVLYVSDGQPGPTFEAQNYFMQWGGDAPRFITVEIGYPSKGEWQLRNRNFTPSNTGPLEGYSDDLIDFGSVSLQGVESGGAAEFLEFIREELKPFINGNFPTIPGQDAYFGDSLGGLFGMFVLLNEPETFDKYILGSPSLWWDSGLLLEQAERIAAAGTRLDARLFMSVGGRESESMIANMEQAARILAAVDGLTIRTEVIPDESHMSAFSLNYVRGVKWSFQTSEPYFLDAYRERHPSQ
jgi:predicted alpha/beta superfamily hydrolase